MGSYFKEWKLCGGDWGKLEIVESAAEYEKDEGFEGCRWKTAPQISAHYEYAEATVAQVIATAKADPKRVRKLKDAPDTQEF